MSHCKGSSIWVTFPIAMQVFEQDKAEGTSISGIAQGCGMRALREGYHRHCRIVGAVGSGVVTSSGIVRDEGAMD